MRVVCQTPVARRAAVKVQASSNKASAMVGGAAALLLAGQANALTFDQLQGLTYLQVKGSGIANTCPVIEGGSTNLKDLPAGDYKFDKFCMEPTSFKVKEESAFKGGEAEFVDTKLMTRLTYTLDEMSGKIKISSDGKINLIEEDGIDYAATTVQLPGGERVPFLFTVKNLNASGSLDNFGGEFIVPSYRGSSFLDPKGRGGSTGYDNAVALPARADDEELAKENNKSTKALKGSIVLSTAKVDPATGEIAGVFQSIQPSDTDLGAKTPKDIKITGLWSRESSPLNKGQVSAEERTEDRKPTGKQLKELSRRTRTNNWEFLWCPLYVLYFTGLMFLVSAIPGDPELKAEFMNDRTIKVSQFVPAFAFMTVALDIWFSHVQDYNEFKRSLAWVMVCIHVQSCIVEFFAFTNKVPVFRDGFGRIFVPHHYLGWMHTTPVMVYVLTHISTRSTQSVIGTMFRLVCIFPCGMISVSTLPTSIRICTGVAAFSLFYSVMYDLLSMYYEVYDILIDKDAQRSVRTVTLAERLVYAIGFQIYFIIVTWAAFPTIWVLSNAGLLTSVQEEVLLSVMNFVSKVLFANSALSTVCMQLNTEVNVKSVQEIEFVYQQEAFLQSVGHEMKTPLNGIIGLSDTLVSVDTLNDKQRKFMELIKNAGLQLLGIIDDILDVRASKTGTLALALDNIDLTVIVNHVVSVLMPLKRPEVSLRAEINGFIPPMQGDHGRIIQVITNLVGNALKFTHEGFVKLSASYDSFEQLAVIQVTDTGIGIPASKIGSLFQEFTQIGSHITRNYGGTGLGLSISKQLVEAHGGTLTASSVEGRGSTFTVRLPLVPKFAAASRTNPIYPEEAPYMTSPYQQQQVQKRGVSPATPGPSKPGPESFRMALTKSDLYEDSSTPDTSERFRSSRASPGAREGEFSGGGFERTPSNFRPRDDPQFAPPEEAPAPPPSFILQHRGAHHGETSGETTLRRRATNSLGIVGPSPSGTRGVAAAGARRSFYRFVHEGKLMALSTDDDPVNQMVIEEILNTSNFEVETARSGEECLRSLQSSPYLPDVLLLDVMMPGMSGLEVLEKIRENPSLKDLPVVLCSALDSATFIREAQRLGCNGFVTKPINRASLMNVLQRCLPEVSDVMRK